MYAFTLTLIPKCWHICQVRLSCNTFWYKIMYKLSCLVNLIFWNVRAKEGSIGFILNYLSLLLPTKIQKGHEFWVWLFSLWFRQMWSICCHWIRFVNLNIPKDYYCLFPHDPTRLNMVLNGYLYCYMLHSVYVKERIVPYQK